MPERTVRVMLIAHVAGYIAGMREAEAATSTMSSKAAKDLAKHKAAFETLSRTAGVAMLGTGVAIGAMVAVAIKKFADFDAEMATVAALTHGTADEMDHLRQAAMTAGQQFGFSATEVAQAEEELVKAGISVKDILGGALPAALTIAADGQMDVGDATQIAAEAMVQFQLSGKDLPHVADLLAAGADKALGSVGDLGEALESGGLVAHQFGLTVDGTIGTLAAFAQAGLIGERGGTVLRQMFLKLADPSSQAKKLLDEYNISLYDTQGNFVGVANLAGQLHDKLGDVDQATRNAALSTIFGSRAIQGANVLYQDGAKGIQHWIDTVNDQGFAAQQASDKLDSLEGDLKKLRAAFDNAAIGAGSAADGPFRSATEGLTDMLNAFSAMPKWMQQATLGLGVAATAAGVLGGGFFLLLPRIVATKAAMDELGISTTRVGRGMTATGRFLTGPWGISLAAGVTALIGFDDAIKAGTSDLATIQNAISTTSSAVAALGASTDQGAVSKFFLGSFASQLKDLPGLLDRVKSNTVWNFLTSHTSDLGAEHALKEFGSALQSLAQNDLPKAQSEFRGLVTTYHLTGEEQTKLLNLMPDYRNGLIQAATAAGINVSTGKKRVDQENLLSLAMGRGEAATKQKANADGKAAGAAGKDADATQKVADAAQKATDKLNALVSALAGFGSQNLDAEGAAIAFQQAVDDATAAVKKNGKTLDINSQKGRDNQSALDAIASSAVALVSKQANAGASAKELTKQMEVARSSFIRAAEAAGETADQAGDLADKYGLIPEDVRTQLILNGFDKVKGDADDLYAAYKRLPRSVRMAVTVTGVAQAQAKFHALFDSARQKGAPAPSIFQRASGGILPGAPSRQDNVLIKAATGEFVVNSIATAANRRVLEYINAGGKVPGFKDGGQVGPFVSPRQVLGPQVFASPVSASGGSDRALINGPVTFQSSGDMNGDLAKLNFELRAIQRGARRV